MNFALLSSWNPTALWLFLDMLLVQALTTLPWLYVCRKLLRWPWCVALIAAAYLFNGATVLLLAYGLALAGLFSPLRFWSLWGAVTFLCCWFARRVHTIPAFGGKANKATIAWLMLALFMGVWVRLQDPLMYVCPPSSDAFVFARAGAKVIQHNQIITKYPAGLSVFLGLLRLGPYHMGITTMGIQVIFFFALLSCYGFTTLMFGKRTALFTVLTLSASVVLYPVLIFPTIFPQSATILLVLPAMLYTIPRLMNPDRRSCHIRVLGSVAMLFLAMTSTYYAMYGTACIALWLMAEGLLRRYRIRQLSAFTPVVLVTPLFILFYFAWALPLRLHDADLDVVEQSARMLQNVAIMQSDVVNGSKPILYEWASQQEYLPAALRSGLTLVLPARLQILRTAWPETLFLLMALILGVRLVAKGTCNPHARLLGWAILLSLASSVSGILELPGYQGRSLYFLLLLFIPAWGYLWFTEIVPALYEWVWPRCRNLLKPTVLYAAVTASCLPTLLYPPLAGKTVYPSVIPIRTLPDDEQITRFLLELAHKESKAVVVFVEEEDEPEAILPFTVAKYLQPVIPSLHLTNSPAAQVPTLAKKHVNVPVFLLISTAVKAASVPTTQDESSVVPVLETPRFRVLKLTPE